jgi:hypothetical protein
MPFFGPERQVSAQVDESKSVHGAEKCSRVMCNPAGRAHWCYERRCVRAGKSALRLDGWVRHLLSQKIPGHARVRKETQKLEMPPTGAYLLE